MRKRAPQPNRAKTLVQQDEGRWIGPAGQIQHLDRQVADRNPGLGAHVPLVTTTDFVSV
jgi:hypothetical protein